jgi:L-threonylcarbamoyladenylate synthase
MGNTWPTLCVLGGFVRSKPGVEWVSMSAQAAVYSHALYATLRALDQGGYARMVWESVPATIAWQGIQDRLGRAAAAF